MSVPLWVVLLKVPFPTIPLRLPSGSLKDPQGYLRVLQNRYGCLWIPEDPQGPLMLKDPESSLGMLKDPCKDPGVPGVSEIHNLKGFVAEIQGGVFELHHVDKDSMGSLAGVGSETFLNNIQ